MDVAWCAAAMEGVFAASQRDMDVAGFSAGMDAIFAEIQRDMDVTRFSAGMLVYLEGSLMRSIKLPSRI